MGKRQGRNVGHAVLDLWAVCAYRITRYVQDNPQKTCYRTLVPGDIVYPESRTLKTQALSLSSRVDISVSGQI